jgi:hypothetical protein
MEMLAGSLDSSGCMSPKSHWWQEAIATVEEEEELSPDEFNRAVILLTTHSDIATSYLAIKSKEACKRFLSSQITLHVA